MNNLGQVMNLNEISIFVKIVQSGSFISAAKLLDMPKSTVSSRLSSLEKRLGVTLIRRTTRKLHVTDAGQAYYDKCLLAISQIMLAEEQMSESQTKPSGLLRITAPVELGGALLPLVIEEFNKKYPEVILEILLTGKAVDFVTENIDLGIRTGVLKDSSLIAKKLGTIYFAPFASPKYLKKFKEIKHPRDLENHDLITFSSISIDQWELTAAREKQKIKFKNKMAINDLNLIKSLTISGMGISLIPTFHCVNEVKAGKLVRILSNWRTELRPVHFVYPSQKFVTPKIKVFIEIASEIIKKRLDLSEL